VGAEGGVEALDVGRVDDGAGGRRGQDRLDAGQGAVDDPAGDADDVPLGGVFDDLGELEPVWQDQPRPVRARPPCTNWRRPWDFTR